MAPILVVDYCWTTLPTMISGGGGAAVAMRDPTAVEKTLGRRNMELQ